MKNVQVHSLNLKKELLEQHPSQNHQKQHLLSSIDNLLKVLKSPRIEHEKQKKNVVDKIANQIADASKPQSPPSAAYICPHTDKPKIVKGMCFYCYNKKGRTKKATKCEHTDQLSYCQGLCQPCYLHKYYVNRRKIKQEQLNEQKNSMKN